MTKQQQKEVNSKVEKALESYAFPLPEIITTKQLRHCQASVTETNEYYILYSYETAVAIIDKHTRIMYDFLRKVYGYTATSAQHIAKFYHDYNAAAKFTWREI